MDSISGVIVRPAARSTTRPGPTGSDLSPDPILSAVEGFAGRWVDVDRGLTVGAEAFARGWRDLAGQMRRLGLRPGDRVLLAVANGPLFPAALAAILDGGGSPLLLHVETPPAELRRTALHYGARFMVGDGWTVADLAPAVRSTAALSAERWGAALWATLDPSDPAFDADWAAMPGVPLHPTSGTTGRPKLAVRPGEAAVADATHFVRSLGIDATDVILAAGPMNHMYTYGLCVMAPLVSDATCVTMRRFRAKSVYRAMHEYGVTIFPTVPAMLDVLLFGSGDRLRRCVRQVLAAGAPLPEKTARSFAQASGIVVQSHYGATETGAITLADPTESCQFGRCVGRPMPDVSVEIRPSRIHADLPPATGTVCVRSAAVMAGYVARHGIDASPIEDGWFRTGDLGACDAAGALYLKGRENEVINVAGLNVIPSEVEAVISLLPNVIEVRVYPGTYPSGSQYVKVAIVARPPLDAAAVRDHCRQNLVYYKRPERIVFLDALPRSPSGKIVCGSLP